MVSLFDDFKEMEALLIVERVRGEVVKDQQLDLHKTVHEPWIATVQLGHGEIFEEAGRANIENRMVMSGSLTAHRTGQP